MLSFKEIALIRDIVQRDNAKEIVEQLLFAYGSSVENINHLLGLIPAMAKAQLEYKQVKINQYAFAADLLIADRDANNRIKNKKEYLFPVMLHTCRVHFEHGNAEMQSESCKKFFDDFVEIIREKNPKVFDYTNPEKWEWLRMIGAADYMESVIIQNIDADFKQPTKE